MQQQHKLFRVPYYRGVNGKEYLHPSVRVQHRQPNWKQVVLIS